MKKWVTLTLLCLAQFFYMSDRHLFGLLVLPIQADTGLNDLEIGMLETTVFWFLAALLPLTGYLGDHFSKKKLIAISVIGWGLMTALTGLAGGFLSFLVIRTLLMTGAQSFYTPCSNALIAEEHKTTRTFALASHQGALYVGLLSSGGIIAAVLHHFGSWRYVYALFGGATFAVGLLFAAFFWRTQEAVIASGKKKNFIAGAKAFFVNPAALCAAAGFIALLFVSNATATWAPKFVASKFALSAGEAGKGVMFGPNLTAMITVISFGFITDRIVGKFPRSRLALQITSLLIGAPLLIGFGFAKELTAVWCVLIAWGFARGMMQANNYASVFDVMPIESRASAVGFLTLLGCIVGSFAPLTLGFLSHTYGTHGFEIGFAAMGAILLLAAIVMAFSFFFLFNKYRVKE